MERPENISTVSTAWQPSRWTLTAYLREWLSDWPRWWQELSAARKYLPGAFILAYWLTLILIQGFRSDHLALGGAILLLSYGGRQIQGFHFFIQPIFSTGVIYDSMRFYGDYIRGPIHVTEPYLFDKTYFGIQTAQGVLTPNEWCQLHLSPALDLFTGFFYLAFVVIYVLIAGYFCLRISKTGTKKVSAREAAIVAPRMMWSFLMVNILGYSTYFWYAAAPPWYVSIYGLGPARMDAQASAAGAVRFDQILGTHFFSGMYGRAADVFGAVPSLHCAYPMLAVYFAFKLGSLRAFSIFFYLAMCFSAVYLNHHYILDILWGSFYALLIGALTNAVCDAWLRRRSPERALA